MSVCLYAFITYRHIQYGISEIAILIDNAFGTIEKLLFCLCFPPIDQISILVKLSPLIIESVCNFVTNNLSDCTIVQVFGTQGR